MYKHVNFIRQSSHKYIHVWEHVFKNLSQYIEYESVENVIFK